MLKKYLFEIGEVDLGLLLWVWLVTSKENEDNEAGQQCVVNY